jgi:hypothetical protein
MMYATFNLTTKDDIGVYIVVTDLLSSIDLVIGVT